MKPTLRLTSTLLAIVGLASAAAAQQPAAPPSPARTIAGDSTSGTTPAPEPAPAPAAADAWKDGRPIGIQYARPMDQRGLNVFETPKVKGVEYTGFKLEFGAGFTSQVQDLSHSNTADPNIVDGVNTNQLMGIGFGFNNPTANLYLNAQLAPGIRVAMTSYLSSRHHNETWVKDGYIQVDESPIAFVPLQALMQFVTLRVGDMEINYGDAHFRRSDNGNALYNPFVGNYIMDAFTTQIGGEAYLKAKSLIAMASVTGGELRGTVQSPEQRGPVYIGKLGFDRQVRRDLRVRLTGSMYKTPKAMSDTLYGGDRAGSRYYFVLENTAATESAQKDSGAINPGFKNRVTAVQVNPFLKFRGLEVFGVIERAKGRSNAEASERTWKQYAVDTVYRFLPREQVFVGGRYNRAEGTLPGIADTVGANRWQFSAGWFVTPNVLVKAERVSQEYTGYPSGNIKHGGQFKGTMLEGVVGF
jgi:hypothetical protein